jgi:hypothetical protein
MARAARRRPMKLDWGKTFLIGFGFFGISVMWQIYNLFIANLSPGRQP